MRSMTGYGRAEGQNERYRIAVRVRSVNHRGLDLQLRLADELQEREGELRWLVGERLARGRVELRAEARPIGAGGTRVEVRTELVRELVEALGKLDAEGLQIGALTLSDLLRVPEVVRVEADSSEWTEADQELLVAVTGSALDQVVAARESEGERLAAALEAHLEGLSEITARLAERWPEVHEAAREGYRERIEEMLGGTLPEERLAQEMVLQLDRIDVQEELDRLTSHLDHFRQIAASQDPVGKRLDFLCQEVLRELNTLGAKCRDEEMVRSVVDAKVVCERIREQLQNIE